VPDLEGEKFWGLDIKSYIRYYVSMNIIPNLVSASDLQRDSARIINLAKSGGEPVIVVKNNRPEAAVVSLKKLQFLINRVEELETKDALEAVRVGEKERRAGKLITVSNDFHELVDD
jgi:prevent-host-death family protein